ncbi:LysR family transcriptional regulator [Pseudomonas sp. OHS18]|uniref:LysR family transcriptional regulator n=1 Tax=Pseudomonas sp. OHS18 TaxID=3399679 RepID=UPI003A8A45E1
MRLDLADLQLFLSIADAGSITAGAARANLALASASERLRKMESAVGVALLERRPRGVSTTEAGEALAHHARLILRQQETLNDELQDYAAGARGTLQLYANTAALTVFLPSRLAPWLAERPRLRIELKERTSVDIVRNVACGLAEAGIVSSAASAEGVQLQPVARDHLVLIAAPHHPLADRRTLSFGEVLGEAFVGLAQGSALQDHINEHARVAGQPLDLRVRMHSFEALCQMVAHGIGLGILPQAIARLHRRRHGLKVIALNDAWARRELCLCFRNWHRLSMPMRSLFEHLGGVPEAPGGATDR